MDLSQLRCFVALAENENLTQVAHLLHVSPSSLSRTIAKLESELGVQVFDRVSRKIVLNSAGKLFLEYVRLSMISGSPVTHRRRPPTGLSATSCARTRCISPCRPTIRLPSVRVYRHKERALSAAANAFWENITLYL